MMEAKPILYGAPYSVYVRAVRLTLAEKGVPYSLVPVDVFSDKGVPAEHLERHPIGRIPAFEHRGFQLYETGAITRYVNEAFAGPSLQPGSPENRARVNQVISILDSYVYRTLVWDIYLERSSALTKNRPSDEARIEASLPRARTCLHALDRIMGAASFLAGPALTLADLHAAPMFAYFVQAPEAQALMRAHPSLRKWWEMMSLRPSMMSTTTA